MSKENVTIKKNYAVEMCGVSERQSFGGSCLFEGDLGAQARDCEE